MSKQANNRNHPSYAGRIQHSGAQKVNAPFPNTSKYGKSLVRSEESGKGKKSIRP